ncbi:hypothetical protein RB195_017474 [Necator americanus]|uniref:Uncharacterized protein n=1 Tax=Necator americanus TaxID=51031 RepID=A0ABR1C6G5_NECAM
MSALQTLQHSFDTMPQHYMSPEELSQALCTEYFAKQSEILDTLHNSQTGLAPAMTLIKTGEPTPKYLDGRKGCTRSRDRERPPCSE